MIQIAAKYVKKPSNGDINHSCNRYHRIFIFIETDSAYYAFKLNTVVITPFSTNCVAIHTIHSADLRAAHNDYTLNKKYGLLLHLAGKT